jgi:hypothetical protein
VAHSTRLAPGSVRNDQSLNLGWFYFDIGSVFPINMWKKEVGTGGTELRRIEASTRLSIVEDSKIREDEMRNPAGVAALSGLSPVAEKHQLGGTWMGR